MMDLLTSFKHVQSTSNDEEEFYIAIACNNQQLFNELHKELDKVIARYTESPRFVDGPIPMEGLEE